MNETLTHRLDALTRPSSEFPRRYLPSGLVMDGWEAVAPYYEELEKRPLTTIADLEKWLLDISELEGVVGEEWSRRYIAMTCATDDAVISGRYTDFITNVGPKLEHAGFNLNRRLVECPLTDKLEPATFGIMIKNVRSEVELFREENIPLEIEVNKLRQEYQKVIGAMTIQFQGCEMTLQQAGRYSDNPDRDVRRAVFELVTERRLQDTEKLDELYDKLLELRLQIARNSGYENYLDYIFKVKHRWDYTPSDCAQFHSSIEQEVMPLSRAMLEKRREKLGLESVKPWDTGHDIYGRPPLRPFKTTRELAEKCQRIFHAVDPELGANFQRMIDLSLLDLDSRKGKAPGGYQSTLSELRLPFIFMNAVGMNGNLFTLLHEGGHAFHTFAARNIPYGSMRHAGHEFAEVASMAMEHLGAKYLQKFYSPTDSARAMHEKLLGDISLFPGVGMIDGFQHWVYTHPGHSRKERSDYWFQLTQRFGAGLDHSDNPEAPRYGWQSVLHLFQHPFYYVEYGIALLGALQVWRNSMTDPKGAVSSYKYALSLGGTKPLPKLFEAAGVKFDFSAGIIRELMLTIKEQLQECERQEQIPV